MRIRVIESILLMFMTMGFQAAQGQTFNEFIDYVNGLPESQRSEKTDSLLNNTSSFPITEDGYAHIIYNGNVSNAQVAGDWTGWNPAGQNLTNISGTDFWYRTAAFDNAARLDYKIVLNGSNWILDPLNPFYAPGGFGNNSELRMPEYEPPVEIEYDPSIPHGTVETHSFTSTNMNDTRTVKVYLPPGYDQSTEDYPMVLVHDGLEYIDFSQMDNTLDYLIDQGSIPPMIGIFVPPVDRTEEYHESEQADFTAFIVDELMSWADQEYRILDGAENHAVLGSSSGGNISIWLGMQHPEVFGKVAAFSPYTEPDILNGFENASEPFDLKIYVLHGSYDHISVIHQSVDAFVPLLVADGYDHLYEEFPEGHSYGFWRAYIDNALIFLFDTSTGIEESEADEEGGLDLYPNPTDGPFSLQFTARSGSSVLVEIFDLSGNLIDTAQQVVESSGVQRMNLENEANGKNLSPGLYHICITIDDRSEGCEELIHVK
ncbi:MAG: T9SS type A sorting domain-containing protein [Flavobacteriales bacterium]|nr:T9SS type A sorting domain-containing protein [Flavobacteriales bacterium]